MMLINGINLTRKNAVTYFTAVAWGYSMCLAHQKLKKKGKEGDVPKMIGRTLEEFYRLQWNIGMKVGSTIAEVISAVTTINDLKQEANTLESKQEELERAVERYTAENGVTYSYEECPGYTECKRYPEVGCAGCARYEDLGFAMEEEQENPAI